MKSEEGFIRARLEKRACAVCKRIYSIRKGGKRSVLIHDLNVRGRNCYTCSARCSKIYTSVANKIAHIRRKNEKKKNKKK